MSDKPVCPDCKRTVFSMPVLRDEQAGLRCLSVYQGATTPDCHAATVARAERADAALAASYAAWRVANDEIAKLLDERDALQARIDAAVAECAKHDHRSDAVGLYVGQVHAVLTGDKAPNV